MASIKINIKSLFVGLGVLTLLVGYQNCSIGFESKSKLGSAAGDALVGGDDSNLTAQTGIPILDPVALPVRVTSIDTDPENLVGTNYRVGPEQDYEQIGDVPWESLGKRLGPELWGRTMC